MSDQARDHRGDGFGRTDRTREEQETAEVDLDQPSSTDDLPWSPPESVPIHSEFAGGDGWEETIDQRIAQEEPEEGTAYGAPSRHHDPDMVGGDDPDAIPADRDVLGGPEGA